MLLFVVTNCWHCLNILEMILSYIADVDQVVSLIARHLHNFHKCNHVGSVLSAGDASRLVFGGCISRLKLHCQKLQTASERHLLCPQCNLEPHTNEQAL